MPKKKTRPVKLPVQIKYIIPKLLKEMEKRVKK
jgi:hypothetical protein